MIRSITKKFGDSAKLVFEYDPDTEKTTLQILAIETLRSGSSKEASLDDDEMTALCAWCGEAGFLAFDETKPSQTIDDLKANPVITLPLPDVACRKDGSAFTGDY